MPLQTKKANDVRTIQAAAEKVATGNGDAVFLAGPVMAHIFTLDVTAAATAGGDTLDVKVQTILDGTNWTDVLHFTQVVGTDTTKRFVFKVESLRAEAIFDGTAALAADARRAIHGDSWRAVWAITGATAAFTFSVTACPM